MADDRIKNALNNIYQIVHYAIPFGAGGEYPVMRDRLADVELPADQIAMLEGLDATAIDIVITFDSEDIWPGLLEDHPEKPVEHWWWHLGAIRRGDYEGDYPGKEN